MLLFPENGGRKMRILITGGAGFIGSHLCKQLIDDGHYVICLDNLFTGSLTNIADIMHHESFEFIEHDVTVPFECKELDLIFNLACPASPVHYQHNPVKTIETNIIGAINTLNIAKDNGCRILQASTSEVYGDPNEHPQKENYWGNVNPIGLRSCYDEGKRAAETLFFDYHRQFGLDIKIARIFNTYGPNMQKDDGRVVSNFIVQALEERSISIYGDGSQTRSFCYVDDLVEGLIRLSRSSSGFHGPVNLGNPGEVSMIELAEAVISITGSASSIEFEPLPSDDPKRRKPDISLAEEMLGWRPAVDLQHGLIQTVDYFKSIL